MPFYEYQCAACGHHHEELQKVSAGPLRKCPSCGRSTLKRLVSAPVFRLKGGGWYETDFKADKENQRNLAGEKEPAAEPAPAAKTEAKTDAAKPAAPEPTAKAVTDKQPKSPPVKPPAARKRLARRPARR